MAVALIVNANLNSNKNDEGNIGKWPTSWKQFKWPDSPNRKSKAWKAFQSRTTVVFEKSLPDACMKYQSLLYLDKQYDLEKERLDQEYINNDAQIGSETHERLKDELYNNKLDISRLQWELKQKTTAAGVEVLRQLGEEDWKLYSRWGDYGIGDLNAIPYQEFIDRKITYQEYLARVGKYIGLPKKRLEATCRPFIPKK